jgi:hypothetical protein
VSVAAKLCERPLPPHASARREKHETGSTPRGGVSRWTVWDDETGDAEIVEYEETRAALVRHERSVFAAPSEDGSVGEMIAFDGTGMEIERRRPVAGPRPGVEISVGKEFH